MIRTRNIIEDNVPAYREEDCGEPLVVPDEIWDEYMSARAKFEEALKKVEEILSEHFQK